jgi:site-specific recombinase XerD
VPEEAVGEESYTEQYLRYLKHVRHLSDNTIAAYRRDIAAFGEFLHRRGFPAGSGGSAADSGGTVGEPAVRAFVAECSRKGLSTRSVNRLLSALRGYYRFLQRFVRPEANPFAAVRSLRTDKPLPSFLFEDEVRNLLEGESSDFW